MDSSESELSDSDIELQNAFTEGKLKPGLNIVEKAPRVFANDVSGMKHKLDELKLNLKWIEVLDCVNKPAPLAPELAARMYVEEQKRETQLQNNKKLVQFDPKDDPVLNDFKRETTFYRQAQSTVMEAVPRIKSLGISMIRPDDYFAEMAKTDEHMQKIREALMKRQEQQKRSERVKELRMQRKLGKEMQIQAKLNRQKEKREMLDEVKKVRKGVKNDFDFDKKGPSKKFLEKKKMKERKYGFGGKKRGLKTNTRDSAADISDFKVPKKFPKGKIGKGKVKTTGSKKNQRPGKNRRKQNKTRR